MSEQTAGKAGGDIFGTVVTILAALVSLAVMAVLLSANVASARQLGVNRVLATLVPASGKLAGLSALDGSEWTPGESADRALVLFGVAEAGRVGDIAYWRDVAALTHATAPNIKFVGLCVTGKACAVPPDADSPLTLLQTMDPTQTHALVTGSRQGRAFIYRGEAQSMVATQADTKAFAAQLAALSARQTKAGGA